MKLFTYRPTVRKLSTKLCYTMCGRECGWVIYYCLHIRPYYAIVITNIKISRLIDTPK